MSDDGSAGAEFARAVVTIETVLRGLGVEVEAARVQTTDGSTAWKVKRGSAEVLVFANPARNGGPAFLRVVSPIWRMPSANDPTILRTLLEMNARDLFGTAFGLMDDDVVLVSERGIHDLDASEVSEILENIGAAGDYFDDKLVRDFGGTRLTDAH
jgi:hypothetical protein